MEYALGKATRQGRCLLSWYALGSYEYPQVKHQGVSRKLGHLVLEIYRGALPEGTNRHRIMMRHLCGVKRCINPEHLVWGTARENAHDEDYRIGSKRHKLTRDQVEECRALWRTGAATRDLAHWFGISTAHASRLGRGMHYQRSKP